MPTSYEKEKLRKTETGRVCLSTAISITLGADMQGKRKKRKDKKNKYSN